MRGVLAATMLGATLVATEYGLDHSNLAVLPTRVMCNCEQPTQRVCVHGDYFCIVCVCSRTMPYMCPDLRVMDVDMMN